MTTTDTTTIQSLAEAIAEVQAGRLQVHRAGLDGCRAWSSQGDAVLHAVIEMLPPFESRSYIAIDLVNALYYVDGARRYRRRDDADVQGDGR